VLGTSSAVSFCLPITAEKSSTDLCFSRTHADENRYKFETELPRVTALAALAIGGGSIGLLLGEPTPLRLIVYHQNRMLDTLRHRFLSLFIKR
jgi:hypothetical protein